MSVEPETAVLLHGFGATGRMWGRVSAALAPSRFRALAPDLPGHGANAAGDAPITFARCVELVLGAAPPRFALCGYSLGGRVALHVALAAGARVSRLVLVSTTAGIASREERATRRRADERLARELEAGPFERFVERWREQPVFAGDPPWVRDLAAAEQRRNRPQALAAVLRGIGTGEMEPLWARLPELTMPALVLAGDRDPKFQAHARRLADGLPSGRLVVLPGGHGLPWECPGAIAAAIAGGVAGR